MTSMKCKYETWTLVLYPCLIMENTFKINFITKEKNALQLYKQLYITIQEFYDSFNSIPNSNPRLHERPNKTVSLYITSKKLYEYSVVHAEA